MATNKELLKSLAYLAQQATVELEREAHKEVCELLDLIDGDMLALEKYRNAVAMDKTPEE